ncbi:MAG: DUF6916 family protein [bacterium]
MEWTQADFEPHLNEIFRVRPAGSSEGLREVELLLVEVSGHRQGSLESFSLLFRGPREGVFRHDTHAVSHPVLRSLDLFMGPIHSAKTDGVYYQAVFTRLRD